MTTIPPPVPQITVTKGGISRTGHIVHLILTIGTCGAWSAIWFLHWLFTRSRKITTTR